MIPAILIWRDGRETEQSIDPGDDGRVVRFVRDGAAVQFRRAGMQRSRFLYVETVDQATLAAVPGDAS